MKKVGRFLFVSILFLIIFHISKAQECKNFYLQCGIDSTDIWSINEKSTNFHIQPGTSVELKMEILKAKDYRISLCGDDFIGNVFHFRILDKDDNVLYNNENDNYALSFSFSCLETKPVKITINIPETGSSQKGCLGVLVEEAISVPTGF